MQRTTIKHKIEILQADACYNFSALLKELPVGCKDTILRDPLLKNLSVKFLTYDESTRKLYKDNLCLFRALALHLQGNERLESTTSEIFSLIFEKTGGTYPANFRVVCVEDIAIVEDIVQADIFLYDIDIVDGYMVGGSARRNVGKRSNTVRLLRYNSHICYVSIINAFFKAFCYPSCDQFTNKAVNLE